MDAVSDWIPVGALGDAFQPDNHCLPQVDDLAGRTLTLHFENGWIVRHEFAADGELKWSLTGSAQGTEKGSAPYRVTCPRTGFYFVDFIKPGLPAVSVSLVLDCASQCFIAVIGQLPGETESLTPPITRIAQGKELTGVSAMFLRGTIDRAFDDRLPMPSVTDELLGKRVEYTYSASEKYEHIYLNDKLYTWRCIRGSEKGLADTDACHYYKIADRLYLFVWREKIVPTLGIVVVNMEALKTTGKLMGYENNDFGNIRNFNVGAYARILSEIGPE